MVKARIAEQQRQAVAEHRRKLVAGGTTHAAQEHGLRQVQPDVTVSAREVLKIEAAAHAVEEHRAARLAWQCGKAVTARAAKSRAGDEVVERGNKGVTEPQAHRVLSTRVSAGRAASRA